MTYPKEETSGKVKRETIAMSNHYLLECYEFQINFLGGVLAPDGSIWCLPENCEYCLKIDTSAANSNKDIDPKEIKLSLFGETMRA